MHRHVTCYTFAIEFNAYSILKKDKLNLICEFYIYIECDRAYYMLSVIMLGL